MNKYKFTNSYTTYDSYKWIRKNKWLNLDRPISEHEYYTIIRLVNLELVNYFMKGYSITFPHRMGTLELRKKKTRVYLKNGKVESTMPVNWKETMRLWEEEYYRKNKQLVRMPVDYVFKVKYYKSKANYNNKSFFEFNINRDFKKKLKEAINNGLDAYDEY